ncbi:hypothetical protein BDP27DRAFT_1346971 [Rhodocollybia butyracea]|uniref:Uncharacterized protein n=1 Tax=Rhodocollybia butyracea TaxID=206335 RepID=A0A9P5P8B0_9AGAR|nr:hypothetical protein BDP27DRAFT_1346971 [Rhodocollybia butyracea]
MSSSNTDLLSIPTNAAVSFDNAGTEDTDLGHVGVILKAFTDRTPVEDSVFKDVMENETSRAALMKALMDNTKLHGSDLPYVSSQSMATDFPLAIEITATVKSVLISFSSGAGSSIDKQLNPPTGTRGFMNQVYRVPGVFFKTPNIPVPFLTPNIPVSDIEWIVDVYAYRHAKLNNVTLIVLHSGWLQDCTVFDLWTTPETAYKFQYPLSYNSKLEDGKYSYIIDYKHDVNMIGPDGKNPIVFKAVYKETFDELEIWGSVGQHLKMIQGPDYRKKGLTSQIHGMSVFNASFEVGTSMFIEFKCRPLSSKGLVTEHTGRVEVKV